MRAVIQRVKRASVTIDGKETASIGQGFLVLLGVHETDTEQEAAYVAKKCCGLRIFEDEDGKMNRSVKDVGGEFLVVSNFTLYGDCKKGNRQALHRRHGRKRRFRSTNILFLAYVRPASRARRACLARICRWSC